MGRSASPSWLVGTALVVEAAVLVEATAHAQNRARVFFCPPLQVDVALRVYVTCKVVPFVVILPFGKLLCNQSRSITSVGAVFRTIGFGKGRLCTHPGHAWFVPSIAKPRLGLNQQLRHNLCARRPCLTRHFEGVRPFEMGITPRQTPLRRIAHRV